MKTFTRSARFASAVILFGAILNAHGGTTQIATEPLITSTTTSVQPNVFLMMDDSGSMGWDYMPDNAGDFGNNEYGAASAQCNGVFYDPSITYTPPVDSTGVSYSDSTFTDAWNSGYDPTGTKTNLSTNFQPFADSITYSSRSFSGTVEPAYYYTYSGTQNTERLKDYYNSGSTFYQECNSAVSKATITVGGSVSTSVGSVTVAGTTITSGATGATTNTATLATSIRNAINAYTATAGYHATVNSSTVTIYATKPADVGITPVVNMTGGMTFTRTAFTTTTGASKFTKVIVSATSGPGATDERTNFANWWSYYRTRMLMMKTATGLAFKTICAPTDPTCNYRIGYAAINNGNNDVLELASFDATQKAAWYTKLYGSIPNGSTPLRQALADVGKMYAHKLPSTTTTCGMSDAMKDPIQYACQQNFTILTTDGLWRTDNPTQLDNSTAIGNQDYFETRSPQARYDGASSSRTVRVDYTTVQRIQSVTSGVVTTRTYGRTDVSIGGACTVTDPPPANTTTANMLDSTTASRKINVALFLGAAAPTGGGIVACRQLSAAGTTKAWMCRGARGNTAGALTGGASTVTDSSGVKWYLVSDITGNTGCTNDRTAFGTDYSTLKGACPPGAPFSGSYVVTTPWSNIETLSGVTQTSVDDVTSVQYTTQNTTNGVAGAVSPLSAATTTTVNVSSSSTTGTSSVGGWTAGTPTSSVCTKPASLPAPSSTASVPAYSDISTGGTTVTTVLSTSATTVSSPTVLSETYSDGTENTLADVAEYYYITDLRTSALGNNLSKAPNGGSGTWYNTDISENVVPSSGYDVAAHQHMTTFTLGLGARGRMVFDSGYESANSGDYYTIVQGSTANGSTVCPWQPSGTCNWPTPGDNQIENIDDLWHAAVNGRGTYFSAANPTTLAIGLSNALAGVSARTGSSAAATTSTPFITSADNFQFKSTYLTSDWTGELTRQQINISTGVVQTAIDWSVQAKLDANSARNIYFFNSGATDNLSAFTLANLTSAGLDSNFDAAHIATLTQLSCSVIGNCLSSWAPTTSYIAGNVYRHDVAGTITWYHVDTAYTSDATFGATDTTHSSVTYGPDGLNLVAFLKGDRTYEGAETNNINGKFFRQRAHVMGDIVNSEAVYVQGALSPNYADPGYAAYKTLNTRTVDNNGDITYLGRQPMVYVGANDGMLHAFYAADGMMNTATGRGVTTGGVSVAGGDEAWAFIPTAVIPNLYKLADKEYKKTNYHQYFVDGSPVAGDICISNCTVAGSAVWKTILVGGLNRGGKSYYALDVTNPAHPVALWEFTDANMGLTYGNPKIVKLKTGQWVALFTSGYNNTSGDGKGYLHIVDAYTGTPVSTINTTGIIGTGVGDTTTPSNLGRLDAWLTTPGINATAEAVYAGDMLGNLWRFDINGDVGATGHDAQLLVTLSGPSGTSNTSPSNVQPITTKPVLTLRGTTRLIMVGTGRYLGSGDQTDTAQQSFYAIADTASTTTTPAVAVYANPRTGGFVQQTQTRTTCPSGSPSTICTTGQTVVVSSSNPVVLSSTVHGWYVDFPLSLTTSKSTGERVNVDPAIKDGTLIINTNEPNTSSCSIGGDSYGYQMYYATGGPLGASTTGVVGAKIDNELANRPNLITLPDGTNESCTQGSGGGAATCIKFWDNKTGGGSTPTFGVPVRKSWRELIQR